MTHPQSTANSTARRPLHPGTVAAMVSLQLPDGTRCAPYVPIRMCVAGFAFDFADPKLPGVPSKTSLTCDVCGESRHRGRVFELRSVDSVLFLAGTSCVRKGYLELLPTLEDFERKHEAHEFEERVRQATDRTLDEWREEARRAKIKLAKRFGLDDAAFLAVKSACAARVARERATTERERARAARSRIDRELLVATGFDRGRWHFIANTLEMRLPNEFAMGDAAFVAVRAAWDALPVASPRAANDAADAKQTSEIKKADASGKSRKVRKKRGFVRRVH